MTLTSCRFRLATFSQFKSILIILMEFTTDGELRTVPRIYVNASGLANSAMSLNADLFVANSKCCHVETVPKFEFH